MKLIYVEFIISLIFKIVTAVISFIMYKQKLEPIVKIAKDKLEEISDIKNEVIDKIDTINKTVDDINNKINKN